ncbi:hypothetical protein L3X38_038293 [Prunus dulcis]|uniref:Uncharacterized protein n=1 Tax=Prunus dulcis TaxID=3755 RepID=A0AAD4V4R6_PRUDU|nr:hypothetical protein L3X38_038293 [Prunus dulcis]
MLPSDMTMSTDIQVAFSFVSTLDICLTSFGEAGTVGARNADQADYGPLNPANLRLGLTLGHLVLFFLKLCFWVHSPFKCFAPPGRRRASESHHRAVSASCISSASCRVIDPPNVLLVN